jgi:hypothetical protein
MVILNSWLKILQKIVCSYTYISLSKIFVKVSAIISFIKIKPKNWIKNYVRKYGQIRRKKKSELLQYPWMFIDL